MGRERVTHSFGTKKINYPERAVVLRSAEGTSVPAPELAGGWHQEN